jgi:hypothetical protein
LYESWTECEVRDCSSVDRVELLDAEEPNERLFE